MTSPSASYQRGQAAAQRAIRNDVVAGMFLTEQIAALHHFTVASGALGNGDDWSRGWIDCCERIVGDPFLLYR